jgi:hypothetical protein
MGTKKFLVCIDEIAQNFVFGDIFAGTYTKSVTMSDGKTRTIRLTPMIRDEREVVELNIDGHITYMGTLSNTTNGMLMVRLREIPEEFGYLHEQSIPAE